MIHKHYSEDDLQALVRRHPRSNPTHIQSCNVCQARFDFLKELDEKFQSELSKPMHEGIEQLASRILSPGRIALIYHKALPDLRSLGTSQNALLLAAQHETTEATENRCVATYASEETETLVRVIQQRTGYTIHVLSNDERQMKYVIVLLREKGSHVTVLSTDKNGITRIDEGGSVEWQSANMLVLTPLAEVQLSTESVSTIESVGCRLELNRTNGGLVISIYSTNQSGDISYVIAVMEDGEGVHYCVTNKMILLPDNIALRATRLLLFK